jgi:hypothetical protein
MNRRHFVARIPVIGAALNRANGQPTESKLGIVTGTDRNAIYLRGATGPIAIRTVPDTRIWKGEDGVDIAVIRTGDEVAARGNRDPDGTFIAFEIWVNITSLNGVIEWIDGNSVTVRTIQNDERSEIRQITITGKTLASRENLLRKSDLQAGRIVHVIGLSLEDGTIQASRIVVYVNGRPVDVKAGKYKDPGTGQIVDKP